MGAKVAENEEKTRSEEVKEFEENVEQATKETDLIQKLAQQQIEDSKTICVGMDKVKNVLEKEKKVAESLSPDIVKKVSEPHWESLRKSYFEKLKSDFRVLESFRRDMESNTSQVSGLKTVVSTSATSIGATGSSGYDVLIKVSDDHPPMKEILRKVEFEKTWLDEIELIKQEFQKVVPDVLKRFESVVRDMSGTGDSELKYKALLNLRSIMFDQIFEKMAPEKLYSLAKWYKMAPPGTVLRKKRFCQPKFFMLDSQDEAAYSQSIIVSVNKTAKELHDHFDEMSELGKKGGDAILVNNCYHRTLSSIANALRLGSQFQATSP